MPSFFCPSSDPNATVQVFTGMLATTRAANARYVWRRPKGLRHLVVVLFGGAGAGGKGNSNSAGTSRGGGGGGSGGSIFNVYLPGILVPDLLFFSIGYGGVYGGASANGGYTIISSLETKTATETDYSISVTGHVFASARRGLVGNNGTTSGGSGGSNSSLNEAFGLFVSHPVLSATAASGGSSSAAGGNASLSRPFITAGGAGGGGTDAANTTRSGGDVYFASTEPMIPRVFGGTSAGQAGGDGRSMTGEEWPILSGLMGSPGAGGASHGTGTGGRGGNATGYGNGGGGGGAGVTGGNGGNGSPGAAIVIAYT